MRSLRGNLPEKMRCAAQVPASFGFIYFALIVVYKNSSMGLKDETTNFQTVLRVFCKT
jgi:hypothetical protein